MMFQLLCCAIQLPYGPSMISLAGDIPYSVYFWSLMLSHCRNSESGSIWGLAILGRCYLWHAVSSFLGVLWRHLFLIVNQIVSIPVMTELVPDSCPTPCRVKHLNRPAAWQLLPICTIKAWYIERGGSRVPRLVSVTDSWTLSWRWYTSLDNRCSRRKLRLYGWGKVACGLHGPFSNFFITIILYSAWATILLEWRYRKNKKLVLLLS